MEEEKKELQLFNIVCAYGDYHPPQQFIDYKIFDGFKDITKDYYGRKPPVDEMDSRVSHGVCEDICYPKIMKKYNLGDYNTGGK